VHKETASQLCVNEGRCNSVMWEWIYSVQKYGLAICTNMESCNLAILLGSIKSIDKKQLKIMKIS
jgi:hypothetical protein